MHTDIQKARLDIQQGIDRKGFFTYVVKGGLEPRFAYTIGLSKKFGYELIIAGGAYFSDRDITYVIDDTAKVNPQFIHSDASVVAGVDVWRLVEVHQTWCKMMLLGAIDFFKNPAIRALQVVPPRELWSIDIPKLECAWGPDTEPVWQWLGKEDVWNYEDLHCAKALTNLKALSGQSINQVIRWSPTEWDW